MHDRYTMKDIMHSYGTLRTTSFGAYLLLVVIPDQSVRGELQNAIVKSRLRKCALNRKRGSSLMYNQILIYSPTENQGKSDYARHVHVENSLAARDYLTLTLSSPS